MTTKIIVLIADRADSRYGEVAVLESTAEAERLVETFLEAGYDPERIRAFAGAEMEAQVSQRPKVDLVGQDPDPVAPADHSPAAEEIEPVGAAGDQEVERSGTQGGNGAQSAHTLSESGDERPKGTHTAGLGGAAAPFFSRISGPQAELMPELLH